MFVRQLVPALFVLFIIGCAEPVSTTPGTEPQVVDQAEGDSVLIHMKAYGNTYVTCELGAEGADKATLVANRTAVGDWERFTMVNRADGKISLKAANGKFVCCDLDKGAILVADRDQAGDWETFTIVPQDSGRVALRSFQGTYISADQSLADTRKGALIGDREQPGEWETFTIQPVVQ